jgi:hypothetical protein
VKRSTHRWMTGARLLAVALVACAGLGCSGPTPTRPEVVESAAPEANHGIASSERTYVSSDRSAEPGAATSPALEIQNAGRRLPIGKLTYPAGTIGGVDTLPPAPQWYTVASRSVMPLLGGVVNGSRYKVTVPPLALSQTTTISIREHSPNVLDFELLPHGTQFLLPVTVDVDYSGTSLDPASPDYGGGLPILLWFNTSNGRWELVVGVNNPLTKKYTVVLTHFSRYAVGSNKGTAEW